MFEEAAKSIGKTAGKALLATPILLEPHVQQAVGKSLEFVMDWLGHVTFSAFQKRGRAGDNVQESLCYICGMVLTITEFARKGGKARAKKYTKKTAQ
jgi:hypothetical protein